MITARLEPDGSITWRKNGVHALVIDPDWWRELHMEGLLTNGVWHLSLGADPPSHLHRDLERLGDGPETTYAERSAIEDTDGMFSHESERVWLDEDGARWALCWVRTHITPETAQER